MFSFVLCFFPLDPGSNLIKHENSFHFWDNTATVAERVLGPSEIYGTCKVGWMNSSTWRMCRHSQTQSLLIANFLSKYNISYQTSPNGTQLEQKTLHPLARTSCLVTLCDYMDRSSIYETVTSTSNCTPVSCILFILQSIHLGCHVLVIYYHGNSSSRMSLVTRMPPERDRGWGHKG